MRSTLDRVHPPQVRSRGLWGRRVGAFVLFLFVAAGASGVLGVRSTTRSTTEGPVTVSVTYAATARSGLDVPWQVVVERAGGFDAEITLAVTGDYFDIYETQGFSPEPTEEQRDGAQRFLTFAAPDGDTFVLDFDAYIQPASQIGRTGTVAFVEADGTQVATTEFTTRIVP